MSFDYKKEYKEFYMLSKKPVIIEIPKMNYISVKGKGNPNEEAVEFMTYNEGLCVQCMHIGSYDEEPITIKLMEEFAVENGYKVDITLQRFHHEIYLSDPRKTDIVKLKTVIRNPIVVS